MSTGYRQIDPRDLGEWIKKNPGGKYKVNGKEMTAPQRQPGGFESFLKKISLPFRTIGGGTYAAITGKERGNPFFTDDEEKAFAEDPTGMGTKQALSLGAYLVPGTARSLGVPATVLGRIGKAVATGGVSGALSGYGSSKKGEELESTLKGGVFGGLTSGAIQGAGEGIKALSATGLGKKLSKISEDHQMQAYAKKVGSKPALSQGKNNLVKDSMNLSKEFGVKIEDAEDIFAVSDKTFKKYGPVAADGARKFDASGQFIDTAKIKEPLLKKLAETKAPELKRPIKKALESIEKATAGQRYITAQDALVHRGEWGKLGNWNKFNSLKDINIAKTWNSVYKNTNKVLDEAFQSVGSTKFLEANSKLKTAIEQNRWAERSIATMAGKPLWNDMTQDAMIAGSLVTGNLGGAASAAASKYLQTHGNEIAAGGAGLASKFLDGIRNVASKAGKGSNIGRFVRDYAPVAAPSIFNSTSEGSPSKANKDDFSDLYLPKRSNPVMSANDKQIQILKRALMDDLANKRISVETAKFFMGELEKQEGSKVPTTEAGKQAMIARDSAIRAHEMLEKDPSIAGKTQGIQNAFSWSTGQSDNALAYKAELEALRNRIRKSLVGTGQSGHEIREVEKFLPKITDNKRQAQQKLRILISQMEGLM